MPSILILGATGYIGAPLSKALKQAHPTWPLTAFVRPTRSVDAVKSDLSVDRVEQGEFDEYEKVKALSREHEIVVNAGSSFAAEPTGAILAGLKERKEKGKLVHVSGGGNFLDFSTTGAFNETSKTWTDEPSDIQLVNPQMFSGASDTQILEAGAQNDVETYIMCPGIVYGGSAVNAPTIGLGYNGLIGLAKGLGFMPYIGDGSAVVAVTHVLDAVDFLVKLVERAAQGPVEEGSNGYERWYNVLTETHVPWKAVSTELARVLHAKGVVKEKEARSVGFEEAGEGPFKVIVASNLLMEGPTAEAMGFRTSQPGILEQISKDLEGAELRVSGCGILLIAMSLVCSRESCTLCWCSV